MKINPFSVNHFYKSNSSITPQTAGQTPEPQADLAQAKMDTITISRGGNSQGAFSGLTRKIASEIVQSDSPARIQELRQSIHDGTYRVPVEDVARSLLAHAVI